MSSHTRSWVRVALDSPGRPGPDEGAPSTSQGRSYGIFQKALQRRNVVAAVAAAKELPQLSLAWLVALLIIVLLWWSGKPAKVTLRIPVAWWLPSYLSAIYVVY